MFNWIAFVVVCWLIADFISGFWHWMEDRYFDVTWPFIGKYIAKPNKLHHAEPTAFLNQGYWGRNWTTIIPAAVVAALLIACRAPIEYLLPVLFVTQANEIHAWAHTRCNSFIRMLQEVGVFQSPRHHGAHHKAPFDCKYCVMSDWLNPVLDFTRFWFGLEWLVAKVLKIKVRA